MITSAPTFVLQNVTNIFYKVNDKSNCPIFFVRLESVHPEAPPHQYLGGPAQADLDFNNLEIKKLQVVVLATLA